jgi:hypothetical protein
VPFIIYQDWVEEKLENSRVTNLSHERASGSKLERILKNLKNLRHLKISFSMDKLAVAFTTIICDEKRAMKYRRQVQMRKVFETIFFWKMIGK